MADIDLRIVARRCVRPSTDSQTDYKVSISYQITMKI